MPCAAPEPALTTPRPGNRLRSRLIAHLCRQQASPGHRAPSSLAPLGSADGDGMTRRARSFAARTRGASFCILRDSRSHGEASRTCICIRILSLVSSAPWQGGILGGLPSNTMHTCPRLPASHGSQSIMSERSRLGSEAQMKCAGTASAADPHVATLLWCSGVLGSLACLGAVCGLLRTCLTFRAFLGLSLTRFPEHRTSHFLAPSIKLFFWPLAASSLRFVWAHPSSPCCRLGLAIPKPDMAMAPAPTGRWKQQQRRAHTVPSPASRVVSGPTPLSPPGGVTPIQTN